MSEILSRVNAPADVRDLSPDELVQLCSEVRSQIIDTVSRTGGHLAANLGVVELTVALLKTFDPPVDKVVWDVGHQTYAYKILTGRKDRFHTLRQFGGLSGFQKRSESKYDVWGAGHSGTALSAALGMAVARDTQGGKEHVVAVIGDAAMSNGISLEAFNNVASATDRVIVVLNDNEMSIDPNVGSLAGYLGALLANPRYNTWKSSVESLGTRLRMGWFRRTYYRLEEAVKGLFLRSVFFEEMGLRYIGPVDGHSVPALLDALSIARNSERPILVHVSTMKGKGCSFAEKAPEKWHSTSGFDTQTGRQASKGTALSYSKVLGLVLERLARQNDKLIAITAAMAGGTGLDGFAKVFPDRFFDVGISEEHAVVFAAGLAASGYVPVFAVYSTFSQRAVDCVIHDVCLQDLPVVLCLDRAGIVGDDGPTHHGVFDIALLRPVPGLVIMQPKDEAELAHMLYTAVKCGKPVVIRYPRGAGPGVPVPEECREIELGRAEVLREGTDRGVQIWALGDMIPLALETADLLSGPGGAVGVVNARFVSPLDESLLASQARTTSVFVTIENGVVTGGLGSGIEEALHARGFRGRVVKCGWGKGFVPHGRPSLLLSQFGLTAEQIAEEARKGLAEAD